MQQYDGHTFAICAYGESPYLEKCILSLKNQSVSSHIIMATATPNEHIRALAEKYEIPLYINDQGGSIAKDWMYGLNMTKTELVTLAHQDDLYKPEYLAEVLKAAKRANKPIIFFTDYAEIRDGKKVISNQILRVKRLMLFPLRCRFLQKIKWVRRVILSFGCPIVCPSVAYVKDEVPDNVFDDSFRCNLDWKAWDTLSKRSGSFVYIHKRLMYHRIHGGSTTTKIINESGRLDEDYRMFRVYWPKSIAALLNRLYNSATKSNEI